MLVVDHQDTDFDLGPINISGNIVMDAVSAIAQMFTGNNIAGIPTRVASGGAQKERSLDELVAAMQAGEELSEGDRASLIAQTLQQAFANDPLGALVNGVPGNGSVNDAISLSFENADQVAAVAGGGVTVPEPGTLVLLGSAAFGLRWFRRRA